MAWKPKTQRTALISILWLNWMHCVGTFDVAGRPRFKWSLIYTCIIVTSYLIVVIKKGRLTGVNIVAYQEITYIFIVAVSAAAAAVCIIFGFIHDKSMKNIITRCGQIDNTLEAFGVEKDYTKTLRVVTCAVFVWIIIVMGFDVIDLFYLMKEMGSENILYLCVAVHLPFQLNSVVLFTFCTFIRILQQKLQRVNMVMTKAYQMMNANNLNMKYEVGLNIRRKVSPVMISYNGKYFIEHFLQIIRLVYHEIVKIARLVNRIYYRQLLLELLMAFILLMSTMYDVAFRVIQSEDIRDILDDRVCVLQIVWIIINSGKIIAMNTICTGLYYEAQVTAQTLRELQICCMDTPIRDEVQQFSFELMLHPLHFNAGGFVYLNNKFTTMFFGTIMTYLTIVVQMSSSPKIMQFLTQTVDESKQQFDI